MIYLELAAAFIAVDIGPAAAVRAAWHRWAPPHHLTT